MAATFPQLFKQKETTFGNEQFALAMQMASRKMQLLPRVNYGESTEGQPMHMLTQNFPINGHGMKPYGNIRTKKKL